MCPSITEQHRCKSRGTLLRLDLPFKKGVLQFPEKCYMTAALEGQR